MTTKLRRHQHDDRGAQGRYVNSPICDGCGKPCGTAYFTDDEVCGGGDGPGFYVCDRAACRSRLADLSVVARRTIYEEQRATR